MVLRGCTQHLLRWPILLVVFAALTVVFLLYLIVRVMVTIYELSSRCRFRHHKRVLEHAEDFPTWCAAARSLDELEGRDRWQSTDESPFYDFQLIRTHMANLTMHRENVDYDNIMSLLRLIFSTYNCGGINNHQLYSETHFGTKILVGDFIQCVLESTILVRDAECIPLQTRADFFRRAQRWYGTSALLLSGGAAMGYYHCGVVKSLLEAQCLPRILSGASAGSLICSFIAVRTDAEVMEGLCRPEAEKLFRACDESWYIRGSRWWKTGYVFDKERWTKYVRANFTKGDTTFLEAYQRYGRVINIAVTATSKYAPSVILNYRSSPDVCIWSAVLASSAFPNGIAPVELQMKNHKTGVLEGFHVLGKKFTDGTIKNDIPMKELGATWNANFFIVSQVNPHLMPFFFAQRGGTGRPAPTISASSSSGLRGGFILAACEKYLKLEMKKWIKFQAELDLLPLVFGVDWRFIYLQKLTGTVTIVPEAPLWSYIKLVSDPTLESMPHYIHTGEKATWYKLSRISNHYRIEKMLRECSRTIDAEMKRVGITPTKEKVGKSRANGAKSHSHSNGHSNGRDSAETVAASADTNGHSLTPSSSSSSLSSLAPSAAVHRSARKPASKKKKSRTTHLSSTPSSPSIVPTPSVAPQPHVLDHRPSKRVSAPTSGKENESSSNSSSDRGEGEGGRAMTSRKRTASEEREQDDEDEDVDVLSQSTSILTDHADDGGDDGDDDDEYSTTPHHRSFVFPSTPLPPRMPLSLPNTPASLSELFALLPRMPQMPAMPAMPQMSMPAMSMPTMPSLPHMPSMINMSKVLMPSLTDVQRSFASTVPNWKRGLETDTDNTDNEEDQRSAGVREAGHRTNDEDEDERRQ